MSEATGSKTCVSSDVNLRKSPVEGGGGEKTFIFANYTDGLFCGGGSQRPALGHYSLIHLNLSHLLAGGVSFEFAHILQGSFGRLLYSYDSERERVTHEFEINFLPLPRIPT